MSLILFHACDFASCLPYFFFFICLMRHAAATPPPDVAAVCRCLRRRRLFSLSPIILLAPPRRCQPRQRSYAAPPSRQPPQRTERERQRRRMSYADDVMLASLSDFARAAAERFCFDILLIFRDIARAISLLRHDFVKSFPQRMPAMLHSYFMLSSFIVSFAFRFLRAAITFRR